MKRKTYSWHKFDPEIGKSSEEGSIVASEVFEESLERMEKAKLPSLLYMKLGSEKAGDSAEIAVMPSAPAEPEEAKVSTLHLSMKEEPAEPTIYSRLVFFDNGHFILWLVDQENPTSRF